MVKGGLLGTKVLDAPTDVKALADLPSREVLLARLAGGIAAPMQQFAGLLQALPRNLAYGLKALIDQSAGRRGTCRGAEGRSAGADADAEAPAADEPATDAPTTPRPPRPADEHPGRRGRRPTPRPPRPTDDTPAESRFRAGELRPWPPTKRSSTPSRA